MQWVPGHMDNTEVLQVDGEAVVLVATYPRALKTYAHVVVLDDMSQEQFDSPAQARQFAEELYS
jgi:predicted glycosyltransferase involved in capsule biosynthesis